MDLFTKIKAMNSFTESEQTFIDFIFNHPYDVIQLNLQQLSKTSYVSISTIYRVMEKLEINGLNQLKLQISESLKNNENLKNIDYNYPFQKTNTHYQILTQMLELYDQTLKNTINLIDLDVLLHTVQALKKANNIYIFPSIGNYFMAESFQQNMLEIGVKVDVIKEAYYQHWHVQLCDENDIVMLISYAGRTPQIMDIVHDLNKKNIPIIDLDVLLHTVQALKKANNIYIFPSIGNYFMAESFQQNMLEIGVKVDVIKEAYYQHWHVQLCDENDIVMLISYAGRTPQIMDIVHDLNKKNIPIILISSTIHTPIDQFAKYHLYFSSYEDSEEKIASFSSRISLQYLLDCIYACYFNRDYEKNLEYKIKNYID